VTNKKLGYTDYTMTTDNTALYARIEDLKSLLAQAESEHHEGSLGIVRIPLKPSDDSFDVDLESPLMERVLVA
jgi:hypothetical protein